MPYQNLTILALFVFAYGAVSGRADRTPINGALVFTGFGLLVGDHGLGILSLSVDSGMLRMLAELTLALVLFTDAASADLRVLRQAIAVPRRLLLIGLPLTIVLGIACGLLLLGNLDIFEVALIATMLAPTDAALGKAVVTNPSVPAYVRQSLNVESGLNDGICVPILFVFLALATGSAMPQETHILALKLVLEELGIGLLVGTGLTFGMVYVLRLVARRQWIMKEWSQLLVITMAFSCFGMAQWFGGSGFIAAFSGGILFGWLARKEKSDLLLAAEGSGDTLSLLTWVAFGAVIVGRFYDQLSWQVLLYSILSLTVVRILPVYLCLLGTDHPAREKLFMGWFGPRGLASIVFGVIVLNENLPGAATISLTVVTTILLSVIAHGLSANFLVARLANSEKKPDSDSVS